MELDSLVQDGSCKFVEVLGGEAKTSTIALAEEADDELLEIVFQICEWGVA